MNELLNKYSDIFSEEAPPIIFDSKSAVCMANYGKYTNKTRRIAIKVNFARNCENFKMNKIDWCEGGMQLADIATKNVGENDLNNRTKYIILIIDNLRENNCTRGATL